MSFTAPVFTDAGRQLQTKGLNGTPIVFTKIGIGDGEIGSHTITELESLINAVIEVDISTARRTDYSYTVGGSFTNAGMSSGFYWRELGLYAADPDYPDDRSKDILYCYQNAYTLAEYIASAASSIIEKTVRIAAMVGDAENVSATIDSSTVYVTMKELEDVLDGYAAAEHGHAIDDVNGLQKALDNKALLSHGTHVTYATEAPKAAGTASAGSADTVSRSDHVHPAQESVTGDAGTVGGLAPTRFMQGLGVITSGDIKEIALAITHSGGFGLVGNKVTGMPVDGAFWYTTIERGNSDYVKITATRVTTNETYTMTYNSGTTTWTAWIPIAFMGLGTVNTGSIKDYALGCTPTGGTAYIHNTVTDMPIDNSYWLAYITGGGINHRCITAIQITTGKTYCMVYNSSAKTWTNWISTADGGNASTVSGISVATDNSLGLRRLASGTDEANDTNCPSGAWYGQHE